LSFDFDAAVIGGGAAGLFCAGIAGQRGRKVLLVEHAEKVGKKILISGGGRCNFTNTGTTPGNFLSQNPDFCHSALARYQPDDFISLVERHRIRYHEKERGQLFCDDSAKGIVSMLLDECWRGSVKVTTKAAVMEISPLPAGGYTMRVGDQAVSARSLVIASGGLSIPPMGASGFGYQVARQFGHEVITTRAGLVPFTLSGVHKDRLDELSGISLPVIAHCNGQEFDGAMLFTHRGISGPAILQISSYWNSGDDLRIDLVPGGGVRERLFEAKRTRPGAELRTVLSEMLPRRFAVRLCEHWLESRPLRQYNELQLGAVADVLSRWPLVASGTEGYRTAEVTLGGVATDSLSSTTMESRLSPGLYFIGEVVDVTGHLGGYNFQWAWASANAAGQAL
jgi:predicted Rossmann fold flavoprotein